MSFKHIVSALSLAALGGLAGCTEEGGGAGEQFRQGLVVRSDTQYTADLGGFQYTVTQVDCNNGATVDGGYSETAMVGRDALYLPNGIPAFEGKPLDADSEHIFGDHYFLLPVGCFDVVAQPLDPDGAPLASCYAAHAEKVEVVDGLTTEILLLSQCLGPGRGGLDVVTTLNHPPVIEDLVFEPSKFVSTCNGIEVCVTAVDPDNDPLEFTWEQVSGSQIARGPSVTRTVLNADRSITQCVVLQTGAVGDYELRVTAYDLALDQDGELVRIEQVLAAQGDPAESRDDLQFPIHAGVECPITGKTAIIVLTLHGPSGDTLAPADAKTLTKNAVDYVNPRPGSAPKILFVHDYNNHNEDNDDAAKIGNDLKSLFGDGNVRILDPKTILRPEEVDGFDVVWFSNPGWPMGNVTSLPTTFNTLVNFRGAGGGLVLQGDDITQTSTGSMPMMETLTYLKFGNNGTQACSLAIDDWGPNAYTVKFADDSHPLLTGLAGKSFAYHNDIDHSTPLMLGETVLASGSVSNGNCSLSAPALVAIDPLMITASVP